jgi:SnoaL-like protein
MNTRTHDTTLSEKAAAYIRATNDHDAAAFISLFAGNAIVNDAGREFRGIEAIKAWSDREIFDAMVTLEVLAVADGNGETVVTTKVDGNFDKTGLPDPVIINHHITVDGEKIAGLTCRLAGEKPGA